MFSYATIVSKSKRSSGLRWVNLPKINECAPKAPKIDGMTLIKTERAPLRIQKRDGEENGSGYVPRKAYMAAKLNAELRMFTKEDAAQSKKLNLAERTFRAAMKECVPDAKVFMTGSYAAGVQIHSSDLDFTVKFANDAKSELEALSHMLQARKDFENVKFLKYARVQLIKLVDRATGVNIDVTVDTGNSKRNTQLLAYYSMMDERVQPLCKAVKNWAADTGVENSKNGRFNSFTLCMMVIHYLQVVAIVPCIQKYKRNLRGNCEVEDDQYMKRGRELREELKSKGKFAFGANTAELGVLFAGFMKYFSTFDFATNWISIKKGIALKKMTNEEGRPRGGLPQNHKLIVVADPFLETPWNCAQTIFSLEVMERIQLEFKQCHERIESSGSIFSNQMSEVRRMLEVEVRERDKFETSSDNSGWEVKKVAWDEWESEEMQNVFAHIEFRTHASQFYDLDNSAAVAYRNKITKREGWPTPSIMPFWY